MPSTEPLSILLRISIQSRTQGSGDPCADKGWRGTSAMKQRNLTKRCVLLFPSNFIPSTFRWHSGGEQEATRDVLTLILSMLLFFPFFSPHTKEAKRKFVSTNHPPALHHKKFLGQSVSLWVRPRIHTTGISFHFILNSHPPFPQQVLNHRPGLRT